MNRRAVLDPIGFKTIAYAYVLGIGLILSGVTVLFVTS